MLPKDDAQKKLERWRRAEEPTPGLLKSLIRAAIRPANDVEHLGAPRSVINRPYLAKGHVGLVCNHVATRPGDKVLPRTVPCWSCADGRPADLEVARAVIEELPTEEREKFIAQIARAA